jgi:hypothetical protein
LIWELTLFFLVGRFSIKEQGFLFLLGIYPIFNLRTIKIVFFFVLKSKNSVLLKSAIDNHFSIFFPISEKKNCKKLKDLVV